MQNITVLSEEGLTKPLLSTPTGEVERYFDMLLENPTAKLNVTDFNAFKNIVISIIKSQAEQGRPEMIELLLSSIFTLANKVNCLKVTPSVYAPEEVTSSTTIFRPNEPVEAIGPDSKPVGFAAGREVPVRDIKVILSLTKSDKELRDIVKGRSPSLCGSFSPLLSGENTVSIDMDNLNTLFDRVINLSASGKSEWKDFINAKLTAVVNGDKLSSLIGPLKPITAEQKEDERIKPLKALIEKVESIAHIKVCREDLIAAYRDLHAVGFLVDALKSDEKYLKAHLAKYDSQMKIRQLIASSAKKHAIVSNTINKYKRIIESKLGTPVLTKILNQIKSKPWLENDVNDFLALIPEKQRGVVVTEYEKQEQYAKAVSTNDCPHVRLIKRIKKETIVETMKGIWEELKKYIPRKEGKEIMKCQVCDFNIICPHKKKFIELTISGAPLSKIREEMNPFVGYSTSQKQFLCAICSEVLAVMDDYDEDVDLSAAEEIMDDDELKSLIWNEVLSLLKFVVFETVINVPKFVNTVRLACYPYLSALESQLTRSRTASPAEINSKLRLFTTIYAFAYFIHVSMLHHTGMSIVPVHLKDLKVDSKKPLVSMVRHALDAIARVKDNVIRSVPGITLDLIKQKLVESFKILSGAIRPAEIENAAAITSIGEYLSNNSVMSYLRTIHKIYNSSNVTDEQILGRSLDDIEADTERAVFDTVSDFDIDAKLTTLFKSAQSFSTVPDEAKKMIESRNAESARLFLRAVRDAEHLIVTHTNIGAVEGEVKVRISDEFKDIFQEREEVRAKEADLIDFLRRPSAICVAPVVYKESRSIDLDRPSAALRRLFDENGKPHQWNQFVFDDGTTMSNTEINNSLSGGKSFTAKAVNKKCGVCGVLYTETLKLNEEKVHTALRALSILGDFMRFYEARCPEGGIHDLVDGQCKKCGKGKLDKDKYFSKYESTYRADRSELNKTEEVTIYKPPPLDEEEFSWTPNFGSVIALSEKLKINQNALTCIGISEGQKHEDVISGSYIPPEPTSPEDPRIYALKAHITSLVVEYGNIKYISQSTHPSPAQVELLHAAGVGRGDYSSLATGMPPLETDFNRTWYSARAKLKPRELAEYCLQKFCELCLQVYETSGSYSTLCKKFIEQFVGTILTHEKLFAEPGYFRWSIIYGDSTGDSDSSDPNFAKQLKKTDDSEEPETAAEAFDMEVDEDSEEGVNLHVGEEYGL